MNDYDNILQLVMLRVERELNDIRAEISRLKHRVSDDFREGEQWKDATREEKSSRKSIDPKEQEKKIREFHELEQAEARIAEREGRIVREPEPTEAPPAAPSTPEPKAPSPVAPDDRPYGWFTNRCGVPEVFCKHCYALSEQIGLNSLRRGYRSMPALAAHLYLKHGLQVPLAELCEFQQRGKHSDADDE